MKAIKDEGVLIENIKSFIRSVCKKVAEIFQDGINTAYFANKN